jgi:hypothetical protein
MDRVLLYMKIHIMLRNYGNEVTSVLIVPEPPVIAKYIVEGKDMS